MTELEQRRLVESNETARRQVDMLVGEVRRLQGTVERLEQGQATLLRMLSAKAPRAESA